jgi:hypothetical protein
MQTVFFAAKKYLHGTCAVHVPGFTVNFRKFSPSIARARRACVGLTVYPPSRPFEPLAFGE